MCSLQGFLPLQTNISNEYRCESLQQNVSKPNPTKYKKNRVSQSSGIYSWDAGVAWYSTINVIFHINKRRYKNHLIISVDAEETFDKSNICW